MSHGPFRPQVVTPLVWVVAGGCWIVQLTLPWTSDATRSRSSFADAVVLLRGGGVEDAVSSWVMVGALALPGLLLDRLGGDD